jgi:hypothetical protein
MIYMVLHVLIEYHSWYFHCFRSASSGVPSREFELGPAVQQVDALLSEPPPHPKATQHHRVLIVRVNMNYLYADTGENLMKFCDQDQALFFLNPFVQYGPHLIENGSLVLSMSPCWMYMFLAPTISLSMQINRVPKSDHKEGTVGMGNTKYSCEKKTTRKKKQMFNLPINNGTK